LSNAVSQSAKPSVRMVTIVVIGMLPVLMAGALHPAC